MLNRRRLLILATGTGLGVACSRSGGGIVAASSANGSGREAGGEATTGGSTGSGSTDRGSSGGSTSGGVPGVPTTAGELIDFSARFAEFEPADEPNGDLAKVIWPEFVTEAGPEVQALYEFQITHGEIMRFMPCFCGCGLDGGDHRSNRDCYVDAVLPDGSVELDSMAPT